MAAHSHSHPHSHSQGADYPTHNFGTGSKWIKGLTQSRLGNFVGGHFSDVNLSAVMFTHRLDSSDFVSLQVWSAPGRSKPSFEEAMKQDFKPAKKGDSFGPSWTNHWFKVSLNVPTYWQQYERVQFEFDPGCEAMIFSTDGVPLQGITGGYGGDRRVEYIIPMSSVEAGKHEIVIESSCNGMFGVPWNGDTIAPPDMNRYFSLASADIVVPNQDAWHLMWDFQTLKEIIETLPGNSALQNEALVVANDIMNALGTADPEAIARMRGIAERVFGEGWQAKGAKVYEEGTKRAQVVGISYCHIDTAWLWPYSVTQQKVARSWSTQVDLMERYPEHRFACSQAQQFKWLEQLYPPLFEKVKAKVQSGQFQLIGGAWVENDGNMPSGEALVRQFLYGQRYFQSRFGKRCETAWLPDSFGLTAAYPQLIRDAGMKYFFTQKLSWNNINVFLHTTFNWVGIDGTQVLCHMTPVDTYTAQATVGDVNKAVTNHKNLESDDTALLVFGNGDGGGGALPKMLENLRRIRATTNNHRDLPAVSMGASVEDFFGDIDRNTGGGERLPVWRGELYLEFHRGTYTSHGSIKKGNRKSEIMLRDVELLATMATLFKASDSKYVYPKKTIDDCWEKVLLNQFHDVLPGSAIGMVYDDAEKLYSEVREACGEMLDDALRTIHHQRHTPKAPLSLLPSSKSTDILATNTTPFARCDVVRVPLANSALRSQVVQASKDGKHGYALLSDADAEGTAVARGMLADCMPVSVFTNGSDHFVLRNRTVQLTISSGRITSLVDVQLGRELIQKGKTGGLVIFEDRPNYWDAWDVEIHHLEVSTPLHFTNVQVVAEGPLRASVYSQVKYGQSTIGVTISLDAITASLKGSSRSFFRFDAEVDWRERHQFLKFELPLDINNTSATYETQFGHLARPTHRNTTWDAAKFEVCGHKFADYSEYGYGVAYLSESKYGFACQGNVFRISLLRAATAPDAEQDQGKHEFSWAVMPHEGSFLESDVPIAAYIFNSPLHVRFASSDKISKDAVDAVMPPSRPVWVKGAPNVILETIKRGEDDFTTDGDGTGETSIVLRLYEAYGGHASATLHVARYLGVEKAYTTNLLEDVDAKAAIALDHMEDISSMKLEFRAFEVKTIKLVLAPDASASRRPPKRESWVTVSDEYEDTHC